VAAKYPRRIEELERIFDRRTNVYIDFANVRPWATKLGWHVDAKRLKQFLDSFDTINSIKLYHLDPS
jgi:Ca2+-binding EF-hand superfamily protein